MSIIPQIDKRYIILNNLKNKFKDDIYKIGIYKISFNNCDQTYIGYASSKAKYKSNSGFYKRWGRHLRSLETNTHYNRFLQRTYNKYGIENIIFDILEIVESVDECVDREPILIQEHNSKCNFHHNKQKQYSRFYTQEERDKHSNIRKGRKHSEQTKLAISRSHKGKTYDVIKLTDIQILSVIKNINDGSTFLIESNKLNICYSTLQKILKHIYNEFDDLKSISYNNSFILKGIKTRGTSHKKSYNEEDIENILSLYRSGYLIKDITKIFKFSDDLIGQIIKSNMPDDERKMIRKLNTKNQHKK